MCVHPYIVKINGVFSPVPCGKCVECLRTYQRDWQFRLQKELENFNGDCWYLTLTYNDDNLPTVHYLNREESCVIKSEVQNFIKRLRQKLNYPVLRYYAVGEYGKNNRAHYHLLIFTHSFRNVHQAYCKCLECWNGRGFIYCKRGDSSKFHYLTKYVNKLDNRSHYAKPFKLMSKSLGLSFLTDSMIEHYFAYPHRKVFNGKVEIPLPRYYVKKLNELSHSGFNGLSWSEYSQLFESNNVNSHSPRFYHKYFCDNYEDIRQVFIENELENNFITKFLDPSPNMLFDWFLSTNKVTLDSIKSSDDTLNNCYIKYCSNLDIGEDTILIGDDFT